MTFSRRRVCASLAALCVFAVSSVNAQMRITEYIYGGANGEFVEFTNVGTAPIDMTGWSFDDSSETAGSQALGAFGVVAPGESVILSEGTAADFRTAWSLCEAVKVIGGNTNNLGRADEINLYDASQQRVDRLTYDDQTLGGPRANAVSAWVDAAGLGNNIITDWTLSVVADAEGSVASTGADIASPGRSTRATVPFVACPAAAGVMRITEYMYGGANGEFVEFTNVGNAPVDMTGWSFDDNSAVAGSQDLSALGIVAAGESVVLAEETADAFRADWHLCSGSRIVGGNTNNLGRADAINLYDADQQPVDRLAYDDQTLGGPRANAVSAWVNAAGLGNNIITDWTLSAVGDGEGSFASVGNDIGSPGKSTRATIAYDPCAGGEDSVTVTIDSATTSPYLDLIATAGAVSGVIGDPTDPAATSGIGFAFALSAGGEVPVLDVTATSSNPDVVAPEGLALAGSGATRQLTIVPHGVGYSTITIAAAGAQGVSGSYTIHYAASAAPAHPADTRFHTGASDASATVALDADTMLVADDETNVLRLYDRNHSGLPLNGFDFSAELALTDPDNPELDLEASTRLGDRAFWSTSYSNSKNFHVRPNRHRVFATNISGSGADAVLDYAGRYDWLLEDMVAWDHANGHGLGPDALGFAASSADGVDSKTPAGFNIEGLSIAPDGSTAYVAFRAPQLPISARTQALIVPVLDFDALVTGAAPGSLAQGAAHFGAPIFFDLGGRGIRSLDRNAAGQYLITAGPPGDATGIAPADFRLFAWTGRPIDAPFDLGVDLTSIDIAAGSFESIADVPPQMGAASVLQFLFDNGDSVFYGDGIAAKDLAEPRFKKAASLRVTVDVAFPATTLVALKGTPQSASAGSAFAVPLSVRVTDLYGNGIANVQVVFSAPSSGPGALLSSTTVMTDASGSASVDATANSQAGSYTVAALANGVAAAVGFSLTNVDDPNDLIFADGFD
ncbi:MAG: lamin tail domain-containing protein [Dokdonella sp.]|uniref:lamin tail domain-containing protein n=1 Tax=Dokdonella sp. TaxID=2291710 RepID=UPI003263DD68